MADNVVLDAGVGGATAAADDIAGVHYQRVKPNLGADGVATDAIGISAALDSGGTGIQAVGIVGQFDDTATAAVTENQFAPARISTRRALLVEGVASGTAIAATVSGVATEAKQDTIIGHLDGVEGLLTTIDADTSALAGAVSGTEMQVDIVSPGTAAGSLGKVEDAAHTTGDVGVMVLAVRNDTPNAALAGADLDYSPIAVYRDGSLRLAPPESDFAVLGSNSVKKYFTSTGAVTDGIIWSPAAGKRWYVTDIFLNVSAAATVTIEDDVVAGDVTVWKAELAANSGWSHSFSTPLFSQEDAADLLITTSAGNVYVTITGYEI